MTEVEFLLFSLSVSLSVANSDVVVIHGLGSKSGSN